MIVHRSLASDNFNTQSLRFRELTIKDYKIRF